MMGVFKKLTKSIVFVSAACIVLAGVSTTQAQTLQTVKSRGKVIVGIQSDNPPFGFLDATGNIDGYDAAIAKAFGEYLHMPVEFQVVTNQNRIAALQSGKVDVLIASLGMTPERAKAVQYSKPYTANDIVVIGPKTQAIKGYADLKGIPVGVSKGSTQDIQLTKQAPDADIRRFDDDSACVQALLSGQVDVVGGHQFYPPRIEQKAPGKYETKFNIVTLYNGAGTRLGDKEWNATLNSFMDQIESNGKLAELYKKYFDLAPPKFPTSFEGVPFTVN